MSTRATILITGGGGMLATALARALRERAREPVVLDRAGLDVTSPDSIADAFTRHAPAIVFNCAAYTKVDLAERESKLAVNVNGTGAAHVARACGERGATLVHYSTDYVFDGTLRRPLRPDDPVGPRSAYGRSKLGGEEEIRRVPGLAYIIVRTAWLYGPNGPNFVKTMVNAARAGKPLRVVNDQIGSPTYTRDLANATLELLDHGARGVWHLTNSGETTWFDFARAIFEKWALSPDLQPTTSDAWRAGRTDIAQRPAYSVLDISPYERLVGQSMRHWRDALAAYKDDVDRCGF